MRQVISVHLDLIKSWMEAGSKDVRWILCQKLFHCVHIFLVETGHISSLPLGTEASGSTGNLQGLRHAYCCHFFRAVLQKMYFAHGEEYDASYIQI